MLNIFLTAKQALNIGKEQRLFMTIPRVTDALPELISFSDFLAQQCSKGRITNWSLFSESVRAFFTPALMAKVDQVVPGWKKMGSYADQQTLIHVMGALMALILLPEFKQTDTDQKTLLIWMVLFHDIAKIAQPGTHDYLHGFRSAAITGKALAALGFPTSPDFPELINSWYDLTYNGIAVREDTGESIQDNRKLPEITSGIDRMYGLKAPAGLIIKSVLLHISLPIDPGYPTVAPLSDDALPRYVDLPSFPLCKMMALVDADAWNLFNPDNRQSQRRLTDAFFDRLAARIGGA